MLKKIKLNFLFKIAIIGLMLILSCKHFLPSASSNKATIYTLDTKLFAGTTVSGQNIPMGGFSALLFDRVENKKMYFWTITDRGPNGLDQDGARPFLLPLFSPLLVQLSVNTDDSTFKIESIRNFKSGDELPLTGIPPTGESAKRYETALDINGNTIKPDPDGYDPEGLCRIQNHFYVSEEYGPDLLQFDTDLNLTRRWAPDDGLPLELSERKINHGLEGLTCSDQYAYLMMQSPIKNKHEKNKIRLIKFDPEKEKVIKQYYYPIDKTVADKIGDLTLIKDEQFLVIEQNGKLGSEKGVRVLYKVDLHKADSKGNLKKEALLDLNSVGLAEVEKIEGIAVIDSTTIALVNDNDFGIDGTIDFKTGRTGFKKDTKSYLFIIHLDQPLY
jgi:hypothetical protein